MPLRCSVTRFLQRVLEIPIEWRALYRTFNISEVYEGILYDF